MSERDLTVQRLNVRDVNDKLGMLADLTMNFEDDGTFDGAAVNYNHGVAVIDFGATPGTTASVAVGGQSKIKAMSFARAEWMRETGAASLTAQEMGSMFCPLVCGPVAAGVGFTIYANSIGLKATGKFRVRWFWL